MKQFYFFKMMIEDNGTQRRKICRPLPGQTTYLTLRDQNHVIDHTCRAQLDREENTKAVRLPSGAIIGICHEGDTARDCRLLEYDNHGTTYYKATGEIFLVSDFNPFNESLRRVRDCDGMYDAYLRLVGENGNNDQPAAPEGPAVEAPSSATAAAGNEHTNDVVVSTYARVDMRELDIIEQSLLNTLTQRQANEKLLLITQIRDRMRIGVARFVYIKQNGETRIAYGTRNSAVIAMVNGNEHETDYQWCMENNHGRYFFYYDLQRRGLRKFCTEDVSSVSADYLLRESERNQIMLLADNA